MGIATRPPPKRSMSTNPKSGHAMGQTTNAFAPIAAMMLSLECGPRSSRMVEENVHLEPRCAAATEKPTTICGSSHRHLRQRQCLSDGVDLMRLACLSHSFYGSRPFIL